MSSDISIISSTQRIVVDAASGSVSVVRTGPSVINGNREYMIPIWAEESGTLSTGLVFSFGNGEDAWPAGEGLVIYVPTGYTCELVASSYQTASASMTLDIEVDGVVAHTHVGTTAAEVNELVTPYAITSGQMLNFNCTAVASAGTHNIVGAWLRYQKNW